MFRPGNTWVRFRNHLNGLYRDAGWLLHLNHSFFKSAKGGRILVYHGICRERPLRFNTLFLSIKAFETQLRLYKKYCNLLSLDDFYQQRFSKERFNICLTFDDGFANNHKYVLPLLEQYQVPAAFFITAIREAGYDVLWNDVLSLSRESGPSKITFQDEEFRKGKDNRYISALSGKGLTDTLRLKGFAEKAAVMQSLNIDKSRIDPDYWLQMSTDQIKALAHSKWATIGSHGYYHNDLGKIGIDQAREEMQRSKKFLEAHVGREIKALAFPYGSYTKEMVDAARQVGYSQLLATEFIFPSDCNDATLRERLTINPFVSGINQLHANITGNYR